MGSDDTGAWVLVLHSSHGFSIAFICRNYWQMAVGLPHDNYDVQRELVRRVKGTPKKK